MAKTFANTFLYNKYPKYEKIIMDFIMTGQQISVVDSSFEDILADVKKRQISSSLLKVLQSKNVILLTGAPLPKQFKVIVCKDVKGNGANKTFIDVSDLIYMENGVYKCRDIDILIAYLVDAMTATIYYGKPEKLVGNATLTKLGCQAFSALFCNILEYIHKISTIPGLKARATYLCSMYYLVNILEKDEESEATRAVARSIANISEREEEIIRMMLKGEDPYVTIKTFCEGLTNVLKLGNITVDIICEKWMFMYGVSTTFALELFPAFAHMMTDAYVGCYINNQKTIEKVAGKYMVDFTKTILTIGGTMV